jgi:hypothetical protein
MVRALVHSVTVFVRGICGASAVLEIPRFNSLVCSIRLARGATNLAREFEYDSAGAAGAVGTTFDCDAV